MKLDIDSKEALLSFAESDQRKAVLFLIAELKAQLEHRVLSYNLSDGPNGLVIAKARAEGAQTLERELTAALNKILGEERKRSNKQRP